MKRARESFGGHPDQRRPFAPIRSSFFGDFEKFDDDDDEEDDEEEEEDEEEDEPTLDGASLAAFRSKMDFLFDDADSSSSGPSEVDELISYARSRQGGGTEAQKKKEEETNWALLADSVEEGVVLIANPAKFCADLGDVAPSPTLLAKFGLTMPPPPELGADRRADLLPVLIIVEAAAGAAAASNSKRTRGVLLNRRTGYLLGDLEQPGSRFDGGGDNDDDGSSGGGSAASAPKPLLEKFCIQPLWFGGVDNVSSGLDMLHQCPSVIGCRKLTGDGLYWGGDPSQAQTAMEEATDRVMTGFDFKFFVQSTLWSPGELERQIAGGVWFVATVSKEVLFKPRDRMGTRRAKVRTVLRVSVAEARTEIVRRPRSHDCL
jgi:Uncharacterized ACR, COG1678